MSGSQLRQWLESPWLAEIIPGYVFRRDQYDMALAVEEILDGGTLLLEAPCGCGKSLAVVAPLLLRIARGGFRAVISTSTIALQQQWQRDLLEPLARRLGFRLQLLLGRGQYLCPLRLREAGRREEISRAALRAGEEILAADGRLDRLETGKLLQELAGLGCEAEFCPGPACPEYEACPYFRARQSAHEASLLLVNHALYFHDPRPWSQGGLPDHQFLLLDEAHGLPDALAAAADRPLSRLVVYRLAHQLDRLFAGDDPNPSRRAEAAILLAAGESLFHDLETRFCSRRERFLPGDRDRQWLSSLPSRRALLTSLARILDDLPGKLRNGTVGPHPLETRLQAACQLLESLVQPPAERFVYGEMSLGSEGLILHSACSSLTHSWQEEVEPRAPARALVSGTLRWGGDFGWFKRQLGLGDAVELCLRPALDPEGRRLLFADPTMPDPREGGYYAALIERIERLAALLPGRILVLFTAVSLMRSAAGELRLPLELAGRELLVQGAQSREETVRRFAAAAQGILFASTTWWEGVELKNQPLRGLILSRLPFQVPEDPVLRVRGEMLRRQGKNSFEEQFLPVAALRFRQGVGRLIRDRREWGVAAVLDSRLLHAPWGSRFLEEFHELRLVTDLAELAGFAEEHAA